MKTADIRPGTEYLISDSPEWQDGRGVGRARAVASGYVQPRWDYAPGRDRRVITIDGQTVSIKASPASQRETRSGYLAIPLDLNTGEPTGTDADGNPWATVYRPQEFRDTWADGGALVAARRAERDAAARRAAEVKAAAQERYAKAETRARALLGADVTGSGQFRESRGHYGSPVSGAIIRLESLERLLAVAEVGARAIAADTDEAGAARARVQEFLRQWGMSSSPSDEVYGVHKDPHGEMATLTIADLEVLAR